MGPHCDNKVFAIDAAKSMINLAQHFEASPQALKGAAPADPIASPKKSVA